MKSTLFKPRKLRKRRLELNKTQKEIADKAKITVLGYRFIEQGTKNPRSNTLARIAKALGVNIDYFFAN